jgi:hypothetical protein
MRIADMPVKRRAAEMVALASLWAPSSTGCLHNDCFRRVHATLEECPPPVPYEPDATERERYRAHDAKRNKRWANRQLAEEAAIQGASMSRPSGEMWVMSRGIWSYKDPNGPKPRNFKDPNNPVGSDIADKALKDFIAAEEERGRGKAYRNGVGAPGLMRKYHKRTPSGGFFSEV